MWRKFLIATLVLMLGVSLAVAPVLADGDDDKGDDDDPVVNVSIDVEAIVDAINQLSDSFSNFAETGLKNLLTDVLLAVFFKPFQWLANTLVDLLTRVITSYPDLTMSEVLELHRVVFGLTLMLTVPGFTVIGYAYITGSLFSIRYADVHQLLPRLLLAIGFGSVAPWLLQYPVRLSELVTVGLKPVDPGFWVVTQLVSELLVIVVLNAFLLLGITVMFIIRDVFLLFAAAAAPLIALGWALPYSRNYASPLIGAFWGFLIIGPLDMIIFRLVLALLRVDAFEFPAWLWAAGGLTLMFAVPYVVLQAGASISGIALAATYRAAGKTRRMAEPHVGERVNPALRRQYGKVKSRWNDFRSDLRQSSGNRFDLTGNEHDQGQSRNMIRQTSLREYGYERDSIYDPNEADEDDESDDEIIWDGENR